MNCWQLNVDQHKKKKPQGASVLKESPQFHGVSFKNPTAGSDYENWIKILPRLWQRERESNHCETHICLPQ